MNATRWKEYLQVALAIAFLCLFFWLPFGFGLCQVCSSLWDIARFMAGLEPGTSAREVAAPWIVFGLFGLVVAAACLWMRLKHPPGSHS
ncbi:MAG: hypothetical protein NTY01_08990 [Verrucomicrobia bacterium]|nr:hypothetical protein [Verrucomicrobiota bacterium]